MGEFADKMLRGRKRHVILQYNPYLESTCFIIGGKVTAELGGISFSGRRLQEWIGELPALLAKQFCTKSISLEFLGTDFDYEDVAAAVAVANEEGYSISLKCKRYKSLSVDDRISKLREIYAIIQGDVLKEFRTPEVEKAFESLFNSDFRVDVVATMSSGKSTLINAMLGQKLMPAKQEACTAIITEIRDNDDDHFEAIAYDINGREVESIKRLTYADMVRLNSNATVSKVCVEGDIPFVPADDTALVLVDTPGPDNSRDPAHRQATERALRESSKRLVLYVLSPRFGTNDDNSLLKSIAATMQVGGKVSRDRFLFVVNQLDTYRKGEDSVERCLQEVKDYLAQEGIQDARIFPLSALTALNIRTILSDDNELDDEDEDVASALLAVRKFIRREELHLEKYASLPTLGKKAVEKKLKKAKARADLNEQALIHSGIVSLEEAISYYVNKYSRPEKIRQAVDSLSLCLKNAFQSKAILESIAADARNVVKQELFDMSKMVAEKSTFDVAATLDRVRQLQERLSEYRRAILWLDDIQDTLTDLLKI